MKAPRKHILAEEPITIGEIVVNCINVPSQSKSLSVPFSPSAKLLLAKKLFVPGLPIGLTQQPLWTNASMIKLALRGASKFNGRFICFPCFFSEISAVFRSRQIRNYAATAQSQTRELKLQDGDDEAEVGPAKTPEVISAGCATPTKKRAKKRRRPSPTPVPKASFKKISVDDSSRLLLEAQRRIVGANITASKASGLLPGGGRTEKKEVYSIKRRNRRRKGASFSNALPQNSTIKEALLRQSCPPQGAVPRLIRRHKHSKNIVEDSSTLDVVPSLTRKGTSSNDILEIDSSMLDIQPINVRDQPPTPSLSYGLERVLFNPGVYHLQDPRSRVYNFDPYLQSIMPVAEFDFNALKEYITSSRDESLRLLAKERGKKYVGSSSSTTGALAHFHFLLSNWRELNTSNLSQGFPTKLKSFTILQRSPSAIFLRWKDGSYAIDADKEFDSASILSMLGRSMEKLLTLPTSEFERYRKSGPGIISEEERNSPESYNYCTFRDFVLRSQLDAHDPRLPGTGMFDLKTRAVVSIRMNSENYHTGLGYEIKGRYGEWESYEREYYDMVRAAFLKYSLQVRMGRMDGIFVAFHNTERIFGFQYVSLPEMDFALHGTTDITTGDRQFKLSLELLNRILDRATAKYPGKSLRIHFETREAIVPFMYIFAEPVSEEQIAEIQATNQERIEAFERSVLGLNKGETAKPNDEVEEVKGESSSEWENIQAKVEQELQDDERSSDRFAPPGETPVGVLEGDSNGSATETGSVPPHADFASRCEGQGGEKIEDSEDKADKGWLEGVAKEQQQGGDRDLLAMTLSIRNKVNGRYVLRPNNLTEQDSWAVEYSLAEVSSASRAWSLYGACQTRRKKALEVNNTTDEDLATNYYRRTIRDLSEAGRKWRKQQDKTDSTMDKIVLGQSVPKS
ncbi:hypothetical protein FGG08_007145 [Glutinoglossum americanum]|uniref:Uncharacterized protein n=1 Tax=Glutinoglossum americanum TaxID=1670608 RepID=A0A9P8HUV3_9PEZI|nr:hypothetical protein FGG08_007145 [Glutinoglossum americanum]